jgi:hypothetical protein
VRRSLRRQADAIPVLFRPDLDGLGRFFGRGVPFDDHQDFGAIPRPDFDGAVEGGERQVRLAADGESRLLAVDVANAVNGYDVHARHRTNRGGID